MTTIIVIQELTETKELEPTEMVSIMGGDDTQSFRKNATGKAVSVFPDVATTPKEPGPAVAIPYPNSSNLTKPYIHVHTHLLVPILR